MLYQIQLPQKLHDPGDREDMDVDYKAHNIRRILEHADPDEYGGMTDKDVWWIFTRTFKDEIKGIATKWMEFQGYQRTDSPESKAAKLAEL